jgi:hypothetical protein
MLVRAHPSEPWLAMKLKPAGTVNLLWTLIWASTLQFAQADALGDTSPGGIGDRHDSIAKSGEPSGAVLLNPPADGLDETAPAVSIAVGSFLEDFISAISIPAPSSSLSCHWRKQERLLSPGRVFFQADSDDSPGDHPNDIWAASLWMPPRAQAVKWSPFFRKTLLTSSFVNTRTRPPPLAKFIYAVSTGFSVSSTISAKPGQLRFSFYPLCPHSAFAAEYPVKGKRCARTFS